MLTGLNHITIAVSNLETSFNFYVFTLGMKPEVKWDSGAYLSAGELWLCLSVDKTAPAQDYSHIAFSVDQSDFKTHCSRLNSAKTESWKENTSEGASLYFLDPDGHKLELHVGDLNSRLKQLKTMPYSGLEWF